MIKPVNDHLLIEPVKHESFMASQKEVYEEVGIVIDVSLLKDVYEHQIPKVGDKVYFDSYLAAKYPKNDKEWYWLVKWEDVRAIEEHA